MSRVWFTPSTLAAFAEREVVHHPEPPALLHELNLVEVRVLFANDAGRAALRTNKDRLRHEGGEGNVGFVG
jgi:hypothetical protein